MKKETKLWIILGKDGNAPDGDSNFLEYLFTSLRGARSYASSWNRNKKDPQVPFTVRRATLVLDDPRKAGAA
jgi:hypothetical protein